MSNQIASISDLSKDFAVHATNSTPHLDLALAALKVAAEIVQQEMQRQAQLAMMRKYV